MIGTQGSPYLGKGRWQVFTGYRYQMSDRHFVGTVEQKHREHEESEVINWIHLFDFAATYGFSERFNLTFSAPLVLADRSNPIRAANREVVDRTVTSANGVGDISLMARTWLFQPEGHPNQNVAIGFGLKLPTGATDITDTFKTLTGSEVRVVDVSIWPGDGGTGLILDFQAFKHVWKTTLSASGVYLFNPRNTVTVAGTSPRSVADQYLLRLGAALPLWPAKGLAATAAARMEGTKSNDLIGKSEGFRRPGYAVSLEPGLVYGIGSHAFSFSVPIAVSRNRVRSQPDKLAGRHGDAAFADYVILAGWSYRF